MSRVSIEDATVTVLLEINGDVHLVGINKEHKEALDTFVKMVADVAYNTLRTQSELNEFLGYREAKK